MLLTKSDKSSRIKFDVAVFTEELAIEIGENRLLKNGPLQHDVCKEKLSNDTFDIFVYTI